MCFWDQRGLRPVWKEREVLCASCLQTLLSIRSNSALSTKLYNYGDRRRITELILQSLLCLILDHRFSSKFSLEMSEHLFKDYTLSQWLNGAANVKNSHNWKCIDFHVRRNRFNIFGLKQKEGKINTHSFVRLISPLKARFDTMWMRLFWRNLF